MNDLKETKGHNLFILFFRLATCYFGSTEEAIQVVNPVDLDHHWPAIRVARPGTWYARQTVGPRNTGQTGSVDSIESCSVYTDELTVYSQTLCSLSPLNEPPSQYRTFTRFQL